MQSCSPEVAVFLLVFEPFWFVCDYLIQNFLVLEHLLDLLVQNLPLGVSEHVYVLAVKDCSATVDGVREKLFGLLLLYVVAANVNQLIT